MAEYGLSITAENALTDEELDSVVREIITISHVWK